jgi:hypothetical protein
MRLHLEAVGQERLEHTRSVCTLGIPCETSCVVALDEVVKLVQDGDKAARPLHLGGIRVLEFLQHAVTNNHSEPIVLETTPERMLSRRTKTDV